MCRMLVCSQMAQISVYFTPLVCVHTCEEAGRLRGPIIPLTAVLCTHAHSLHTSNLWRISQVGRLEGAGIILQYSGT